MQNTISCKNCHMENPIYGMICKNCKAYLREKIFNIDLWPTLGLLVENPRKGFNLIIKAEHKNFIFFISFFAAFKFLIDSMFISLAESKQEPVFGNFIKNYFIEAGTLFLIVFLFSLIFKLVTNNFGVSTRIKDNFSILVYSMFPHVLGGILLFVVELTIFGGNVFSNNPSPFQLKEFLAYTLLLFEGMILLWSMFLSFMAVLSQTRDILYSVISAIIFNFVLYYCIYLNSHFLFN